MPVFEFICRDCGAEMTEIRSGKEDRSARCPSCGSVNTERLLSPRVPTQEKKGKAVPCSTNRGG